MLNQRREQNKSMHERSWRAEETESGATSAALLLVVPRRAFSGFWALRDHVAANMLSTQERSHVAASRHKVVHKQII